MSARAVAIAIAAPCALPAGADLLQHLDAYAPDKYRCGSWLFVPSARRDEVRLCTRVPAGVTPAVSVTLDDDADLLRIALDHCDYRVDLPIAVSEHRATPVSAEGEVCIGASACPYKKPKN